MKNAISNLSQVFPPGTAYYYGFPAGWDSGFYNNCPPEIEELVAMRPAVCAGENMRIVTFASTVQDDVWNTLKDDLGVPLVGRDRILALPSDIDCSITGEERNNRIRDALMQAVPNSRLIMAQPYTKRALWQKYLINPGTTTWLNDKDTIHQFVPQEYCTPEYADLPDGQALAKIDGSALPYPCVIKVSASSAGDGVRVCRSIGEFQAAQEAFKESHGAILIQKYIEFIKEIDVKFAVYQDKNKPFELIGYSKEITGENGEYMGGIVENTEEPSGIVQQIYHVLKTEILPTLKEKGWFGVGGVDVLVDKDGAFYFNDFNCRMTATMAQTMQMNSGLIGDRSLLVFNGTFPGTIEDFRKKMIEKSRHGSNQQVLNVVALANGNNVVRMHAGVLFDQPETLRENVLELERLGVQSDIFREIGPQKKEKQS